MKKIISLVLLCSIFMSCTSAKLISSTTIPSEKETIYISFDNTQATGMDLKGDMKGALKNALQSIPNR